MDKRVRKKARVSLRVKTVADKELTREKEKEGRARKQSNQRGEGEKGKKKTFCGIKIDRVNERGELVNK